MADEAPVDAQAVLVKVRVLFVLSSLAGGGAERHFLKLSEHLDRDRFEVRLVVSWGGGVFEPYLPDDVGYEVLGSRWRLLGARRLRRTVRRWRPDVVCPITNSATLLTALSLWGRARRPALVAWMMNPLSPDLRVESRWSRRLMLRLLPRLYGGIDHVVAPTRGVAEDVGSVLPGLAGRTTVIPNAVVDDAILRLGQAREAADEVPTVLLCGRLVPIKGFAEGVRAFARVRREVKARLRVVGAGPLRGELEALVDELDLRDDVELAGFVAEPYALMAAAEVLVMPSLGAEGFGNVMVEAMAVGTPVVAFDCGVGPRELVEHESNGLLVSCRHVGGLAEAILRLLRDDDLRHRLSEAARTGAGRFHASEVAARYEAVAHTLVEGNARS